ncbi:MAG TPA: nucleotidyl transferase AbiEii/AbiGii toxin family protein [Streptosporangiaceae bacterium]|nr:nucleotidyl transferase AbiEii/AbiGii toxin family protein [Streptosporangiaceae bacterium]
MALEDVIGTKVRALADRGAARDLIDVRAASRLYSPVDLENFGRRHARDEFSLEELAARLDGAEWFDDEAFTVYGLTENELSDLRTWARAWSDDIAGRVSEEVILEDLP